eukprot:TRINITY_DN22508_c1_g1_i3.p2 TRINITY_DN22508_c1_g1~~TRINITY_DN22508_c1_g1_i3.p2  ORF type:complete len:162 (+),score=24.52 TRINITY_DN22508_c1_g1_i3:386-871(+)
MWRETCRWRYRCPLSGFGFNTAAGAVLRRAAAVVADPPSATCDAPRPTRGSAPGVCGGELLDWAPQPSDTRRHCWVCGSSDAAGAPGWVRCPRCSRLCCVFCRGPLPPPDPGGGEPLATPPRLSPQQREALRAAPALTTAYLELVIAAVSAPGAPQGEDQC